MQILLKIALVPNRQDLDLLAEEVVQQREDSYSLAVAKETMSQQKPLKLLSLLKKLNCNLFLRRRRQQQRRQRRQLTPVEDVAEQQIVAVKRRPKVMMDWKMGFSLFFLWPRVRMHEAVVEKRVERKER